MNSNSSNQVFPSGLDAFIQEMMQKSRTPGLAVGVMRDGKMLVCQGYGTADIEQGLPVSDDTIFQLFSTTKMFTGSAIISLVEEGHFNLETRAKDLLPEIPANWGAVTVYHLLTHTSGLPDIVPDPMSGELISREREEAMRLVFDMPLQAQPGEKWSYNQTNYALLGFIVEACSGYSFPDYVERRFFQPLGMTSSFFSAWRGPVKGRSAPYMLGANGEPTLRPYDFPAFVYTGAGLNTTVFDLARWDAGLFYGQVLKESSLKRMFTPVKLNDGTLYHIEGTEYAYGSGWFVNDRVKHPYVGHSGGMCTAYIHFIQERLGVAILANMFGANPEMLAEGVAEYYLS
jgi:CubicO group peptidase (beta-lactamase class C family)